MEEFPYFKCSNCANRKYCDIYEKESDPNAMCIHYVKEMDNETRPSDKTPRL